MKHYSSSIPDAAQERVTACFIASQRKFRAEYVLAGKVVGVRQYHETGDLEGEWPLKDGLLHGIQYRCDVPGNVLSAEPYFNGLPHGVAKQWSDHGKLIGTYWMVHGTGIDLWWCERADGRRVYLSEARYLKDGKLNGFEWWLNEDQHSVIEELHFKNGQKHGIGRRWNQNGRLSRGYPQYWINDRRVTRRQYSRECHRDSSLPHFREKDNRPQRSFPKDIKLGGN